MHYFTTIPLSYHSHHNDNPLSCSSSIVTEMNTKTTCRLTPCPQLCHPSLPQTVSFLLGGLELGKVSALSPEVEDLAREAFKLFNDTLASLSPRADGDHLSPEGAFEEQVKVG